MEFRLLFQEIVHVQFVGLAAWHLFLAKPPNPSLGFSVPVSKGVAGGLGNKRVRNLAVKVFHPVTKLATDRVNPKG